MKFKKEMAELRRRKVVSKKLAVDKFKASKEYKEGLEGATSLYFGKGFNQSKKQINLLFLDLNINDL